MPWPWQRKKEVAEIGIVIGPDMDDDEATYLVDQYNKYVSWALRSREVFFAVSFGFAMASLALLYSIAFQVMPKETKPALTVLAAFTVLAYMTAFIIYDRRFASAYKRHRIFLCSLEDYRSRHKSLPKCITFKAMVEEPKEVEKLLKECEKSKAEAY